MSFRWNNISHRENTDYSFTMNGNELYAKSIGITANRTMLSCVMNMDAKEYKYYKSQAEILQSLSSVFNRKKQQAFRQIQKFTHYHRDFTNTVFLPQALNHGNYNALSQFLGKLRTNRVGSYVKLSLQESKGYFEKAVTLLKPTTKIVHNRMKFGFVRLKKNMIYQRQRDQNRLVLQDLSSIQNTPTQKAGKANLINLTYTLIRFHSKNKTGRQSMTINKYSPKTNKKQNKSRYIHIDYLLTDTHAKEYQFKNLDIQDYSRRKYRK